MPIAITDTDLRTSVIGSTMQLSIIIVNWNSLAYLRDCLATIYAGTTSGFRFEVIVVDNASTHENVDEVKLKFPDVVIIRSNRNLGFAGANNLGFQHSSGKFLLFLNPDTKIIESAISTMVSRLDSIPEAGVMGCKLLNSDGSLQTSCVQRFPTIANQLLDFEALRAKWPGWKIWGIRSLFSSDPKPANVEVVSGACLMIKRAVFEAADMFSREYFMYAEDVDLCYQVRRLGWHVYCTNEASVVHYGGGTSVMRKGSAWVAVMQRKAILRFYERTRGRLYGRIYRFAMGFAAALRLMALMLLAPFRHSAEGLQSLRPAMKKWAAILCWSFGYEISNPRAQEIN